MRSLLDRLGLFGRTGAESSGQSGSRTENAESRDVIALQRRLDRLLAKRRDQIEDVVYRIDFADVSEELGPAWKQGRHFEKIRATIEGTLGPNDISVQYDNSSFLLIFPLLGMREGRLKAAKIYRDIEVELFGSELPPQLISLQQASLGAGDKIKFVDCPDPATLVSDFVDGSHSDSKTGERSRRKAASDAGPSTASSSLAGVELIYRPMLSAPSRIVFGFAAIPVLNSGQRFAGGYHVLANSRDGSQILSLDKLSLTAVFKELRQLASQGGKSLFVVPVHYETLTNLSRRLEYLRFASAQAAGLEKRLIIELVGLPPNFPQARMVELVSAVSPLSRAVIARLPLDVSTLDYGVTGLHAVGVDLYESAKSETYLMRRIESFADLARKARMRSYAHGIRSLSLLTAAIASGFEYVAGHSLGPPLRHAEDVSRYQLDDLYRQIMDALPSPHPGELRDGIVKDHETE